MTFNRVIAAAFCLCLTWGSFADLRLQNGADIDMNGSAGSQIIFPDGTTQSSALESGLSLPAGHGGTGNSVSGTDAYVGGGQANTASGDFSTAGGGLNNAVQAPYGTIAGGGPSDPTTNPTTTNNRVTDIYGTIGGGANNQSGDAAGTTTDAPYATVSGGRSNNASGYSATVGGGDSNTASSSQATVGGGIFNTASGSTATVAGGYYNTASGSAATVAGGYTNTASGIVATVGGGSSNSASSVAATVGGGYSNEASSYAATVGGGAGNTASGSTATVGGGDKNAAGGSAATVAGGLLNTAAGDYSFAAGRRAKIDAAHDGTFLFADQTDADFSSAAVNEFAVRANGGVRFITNSGTGAGVGLDAGDTSWNVLSAKETKENYSDIDPIEILRKVSQLPIQRWNYVHQDESIQHIGPYAADFHEAFKLHGEYDGTISSQDLDGVALAAIQGLNHEVALLRGMLEQRDGTIEALLAERNATIEALQRELETLKNRINSN